MSTFSKGKGLKVASNWIMDNILKKGNFIIFIAIITITSIVFRIAVIDFQSADYLQFLKGWVTQIATNGGFKNFGKIEGYDYTMPYLYILTTVSYFKPEHWLYGIKAVSIFFDFVLAVFVGLISKKICKTNNSFLFGYGLTLLLPNVILNSAIWGQCDVIFTTFIVISIYFLLNNNGRVAMIMYGCAFCLKIQAIFFFPVILFVMAKKKVNFFYFIYAILAIITLNIPAFCMGVGFKRAIITPIETQTEEYITRLCSGAPNLYYLIDNMAHYGLHSYEPNVRWREWFAEALVPFAIAVVTFAFALIYRKKSKLTGKKLVLISYFFAMLVPYVLPHMHERYWYLSDVLAVLFVVCYRKHFYIAFLSCYASFRACLNYVFDTQLSQPINQIFYALIMLVAIILVFRLIYKEFSEPCQENEQVGGEKSEQNHLQNNGNCDINKDYIVTNLASGSVEKSVVTTSLGVVEEQSLEEFLSEETPEEKALEQALTKTFGNVDLDQEEQPKEDKV